jgi:hypothetical protein
VPELQAPWDLVPDSVMTNAVVTGIVNEKTGRDLKLAYKGTPTEVIVGPNIPIVTYARATHPCSSPAGRVHHRAEGGRRQPVHQQRHGREQGRQATDVGGGA